MSTNNKILLIADHHPILVQALTAAGFEVLVVAADDNGLLQYLAAAVGIITSNALKIDTAIIDAAPNLKFIGRLGSGMEIIDTDYAEQKGIECYSSPEGNANAVAEHCLGMLLTILHRQAVSNNELKQGVYLRKENTGFELANQAVGIIGYGNNGSLFAQKLALLGATVYVYDKYKSINSPHPNIIVAKHMEELQALCTVLSLHLPASPETLNFVDEAFLEKMAHPFIFINCARGKLISTDTLLSALKNGKMVAAGIDVYEQEPLFQQGGKYEDTIKQIIALPQVVVTPHIAGYTFDATFKMSEILAAKILSGNHLAI